MSYRSEGFCLECKAVVRFPHVCPHHHHNAIGPFEGPGGDSGHSHGEGGQGMGGIDDPHQKQRGLHGDEEHEHTA